MVTECSSHAGSLRRSLPGLYGAVKPFYLVGRRLIWRGPELLYSKQATDFCHYPAIHFFALITLDGKRGAETVKDLLNQNLSYGFRFFIS